MPRATPDPEHGDRARAGVDETKDVESDAPRKKVPEEEPHAEPFMDAAEKRPRSRAWQ